MRLSIKEIYVFYGLIILNTIPVFCFDFFPTMDGPAHLYNVELIKEIVAGNEFVSSYFELNAIVVPNWLGHGLLLLFSSFLSSNWAEKMMFLTFMIAFPLSFRYFLNKLKITFSGVSEANLAPYLIFPLCYSMPLHYGFFNFCFGLIFLFFALGYFFHSYSSMNNKKGAVLGLLVLFTYLSHFFVFGLLLIFILLSYVVMYFSFKKYTSISEFIRGGFRYIVYFAPALFLCVSYLTVFSFGGTSNFLEKPELFSWIFYARPLIYFEENEFSKIFFLVMVVWTALLIYNRQKIAAETAKISVLFLVVILLFYFLLPNETSSAGFISIRLLTLFFLFWIVALSLTKVNRYFGLALILLALFVHVKIMDKFIKNGQEYSDLALEIVAASKAIDRNAIVLSINASNDWMKAHFSNYLAIEKEMVILENYEASNSYFPVRWKMLSVKPSIEQIMDPCLKYDSGISPYLPIYNYIFVLKREESMTDCFQFLEDRKWANIYDSKSIGLWSFNEVNE